MDVAVAICVLILISLTWLLYLLVCRLEPCNDNPAKPTFADGEAGQSRIAPRTVR